MRTFSGLVSLQRFYPFTTGEVALSIAAGTLMCAIMNGWILQLSTVQQRYKYINTRSVAVAGEYIDGAPDK